MDIAKKELETIAMAMLDKRAKNVISLDLRKIGTAIADYFVICGCRERRMRSG